MSLSIVGKDKRKRRKKGKRKMQSRTINSCRFDAARLANSIT
jgi:hypothetical protein